MTLVEIANQMRSLLIAENSFVSKTLARGLHVLLQRKGTARRLAVARLNVSPSPKEVEIIGRAFGVAPDMVWTQSQSQRRGTPDIFQVIECRWVEAEIAKAAIDEEKVRVPA
ncbi:MAG: hypothetical protein ACTS5I_04880 [Rhodanobacter sp.]